LRPKKKNPGLTGGARDAAVCNRVPIVDAGVAANGIMADLVEVSELFRLLRLAGDNLLFRYQADL